MYFSERVILAAKNVDVHTLNEATLRRLPNEEKTYHSADEAFDDGGNQDNSIPQEYLNSITISGMPLHLTTLKVGSVVILLRNLDYAGGQWDENDYCGSGSAYHKGENSNGATSRRTGIHSADCTRYSHFFRPSLHFASASVSCTTCICNDTQQVSRSITQSHWDSSTHPYFFAQKRPTLCRNIQSNGLSSDLYLSPAQC